MNFLESQLSNKGADQPAHLMFKRITIMLSLKESKLCTLSHRKATQKQKQCFWIVAFL